MSTARTVALLRAGPRGHLRAIGYLIAVAGPAAVVLMFLPFRDTLQPLTIGFTFLIVVVAAAIVGRLGPGLLAAVVSFLTFNFFFLPPYDSFVIARGEHVVALVVFLALSVLISSLYSRAVERAEVAEAKERELQMLQELSRDLVVRGPGEEAYGALLGDVVARFGFDAGALFVSAAEGGGLDERVVVGAPAGSITPSWNPADPGRAPERLPLSVGNRTLGLIVLTGSRPTLDPAEVRVLRAVCDQLALVLERDRLLRAATDAEILRQTETARRTMLAAVSHDLRSPLAAIKASVTDLLDPAVERSTADRAAVLHVVDSEADRLDALVANLLDLSRIEAGVVQVRLEHVDLAETVTAEVDAAALRWPNVHIAMAIDDGHEVAVADPVFFPRVVSNLLDNAARSAAAAGSPSVEIEIGPTDHGQRRAQVAVKVVDHGAGLTSSERTQLFLPFARLDERTTKLGSGLGLAIARGFVDLMGGEIWLEDTPGGGATFAFSLQEAS
jgi:two-component system sensor histidine kinase KdpD